MDVRARPAAELRRTAWAGTFGATHDVCILNFVALLFLAAAFVGNARAECGIASTYHEGQRTANGERYNPGGMSAAHKHLPFGSHIRVRNQRTGRTIEVRINDRGPFVAGRVIDLSTAAMRAIGGSGLIPVCIER